MDMKTKRCKILLVNPWISDFTAYDLWSKPIGLLYIAKFLIKYGYEVELLDLTDRARWGGLKDNRYSDGRGKYFKTIIEKPEAVRHIPRRFGLYGARPDDVMNYLGKAEKPDIVLMTSIMTYWYHGIIYTLNLLRQYFGSFKLILGGIYATLCPEHAKNVIMPDFLVAHYGEKKALQIIDSLTNAERDYSKIPEFDDSGMLPWFLYNNIEYALILTSRGCPFHCSYCATRFLNTAFTRRNTEDVIEEIVYINNHYGVKDFVFYDDALLYRKKEHIFQVLNGLNKRGIKVHFHTPNGLFVREIDQETAELMKESGFKTIRLSVETVSEKFLQKSCYKINRNLVKEAIENLKKAGYKNSRIEVYLMVGMPGQKFDDVIESIKFISDLGAVSRLSYYSPIPHTKDWDIILENTSIPLNDDPIYTNNTVYPYYNNDLTWQEIDQLKLIANELNKKAIESEV